MGNSTITLSSMYDSVASRVSAPDGTAGMIAAASVLKGKNA